MTIELKFGKKYKTNLYKDCDFIYIGSYLSKVEKKPRIKLAFIQPKEELVNCISLDKDSVKLEGESLQIKSSPYFHKLSPLETEYLRTKLVN